MNYGAMGKILVLIGSAVIILGLLMIFFDRIPLIGKIPGDIVIRKKNYTFYFPLGTMILLSVGLSLIFYIISYFKK